MTTRRGFVQAAIAGLATPALSKFAAAEDAWPSRPIHALIPFSAGSSVDIVGRVVLAPLAQRLGQAVVVENRGGAGGTIGCAFVAQQPADGYTILVNASAHTSAPAIYPGAPYDVTRDFSGVIPFGSVPNVVIIAPSKGVRTLKDLVAAAKAGNMTFASAGVGSATHLAAERLRLSAGFNATHVPFKGGVEAITEVITGRVDFACMGVPSALPFIDDNELLALAVCTQKRTASLPDVATTIELGYPDSDYNYWMGMFVPAKTDRAILEKLRAETQKAMADPDTVEKLKPQGMEPMPLSPGEFDALVKKEVAENITLVKAAGIKVD
ncbi:MAG TPA: tripartite tricarboxylate transporter substrate binding protein [Xanthobacteraceae bacterium]|jgi:tripartite-type tricarboxylate transporter receptor subunit TctC|nr:tripartite tricarboxylate transporter substrate binding protein [Xanthobacteraceae bacterium]